MSGNFRGDRLLFGNFNATFSARIRAAQEIIVQRISRLDA
jgi:hypothetical protein